ncbi:hypothetical protein FDK21_12770 [Cohaesibacter sp. CAU 1516]|uniref:hypothetical protein n=1 Tax=Cohaesibacter sp. CAU 1516 TaxID=2576038 RepID=UPI0010FD98D0|nr:hypothetical protein [Cohaesibacter sp. CAU 1516]TLP45611.1 hypothetical protein FDK21_12770 [Cohaesibacter sp. CAU 1516]
MPFDAPHAHHQSLHEGPVTHLTPPAIAPSGVELTHLLAHPQGQCDLEGLAAAISMQDLAFECEGDGQLAQHPAFPAAVRQVIGSELMSTASREALAGLPCPWGPACGLHVFFNGQSNKQMAGLACPWLVRTDSTGANSMRVTLRLFGLGQLWCNSLGEAAHRALERGINLAGVKSACQGVLIRSVDRLWSPLQDPVPTANRALVHFTTPFHGAASTEELMDSPSDQATVGSQFLSSLLSRAEDIARWHGLSLAVDRQTLDDAFASVQMTMDALDVSEWNRAISQSGTARIPMRGHTGLLQLQLGPAQDPALLRLLQIGSQLHCGQDLAFGLGRYELFLTADQDSSC